MAVDIKELKKLVKYLRKEGISEFKSGDLEFKLGPEPVIPKSKKTDVSDIVNDVATDGPTQEDLLFWSAGGAATKEDS